MDLVPMIQPTATLVAAFLGPYLGFRWATRRQKVLDEKAQDHQRAQLTLRLLRDYEDPEFSNRRVTLAEFQRDWGARKDDITNIVFPPDGQSATVFFSRQKNAEHLLFQHQNVNRFLAYVCTLVEFDAKGLLDRDLLQIWWPRYCAYKDFLRSLADEVDRRVKHTQSRTPRWVDAIRKIEKLLSIP